IIISDGVIWTAGRINALKKIKAMSKKGITTYTIGVGFDTNEGFMNQLASDGNGLYFRPEEWERLKLEFEEKEEKRDEGRFLLKERRSFRSTRSLTLPEEVDEEKISANLKDGILRVELPKKSPKKKKVKKIKIR
ncbi:MAG TPA: Hsp20 family protein, partial [Euryarchaeota archaeon]|nr:Hsp20 family protein [Euryarchaeota archaeon]